MFNNKKMKGLWLVISIIAIIGMIFFTILPAFYGSAGF